MQDIWGFFCSPFACMRRICVRFCTVCSCGGFSEERRWNRFCDRGETASRRVPPNLFSGFFRFTSNMKRAWTLLPQRWYHFFSSSKIATLVQHSYIFICWGVWLVSWHVSCQYFVELRLLEPELSPTRWKRWKRSVCRLRKNPHFATRRATSSWANRCWISLRATSPSILSSSFSYLHDAQRRIARCRLGCWPLKKA